MHLKDLKNKKIVFLGLGIENLSLIKFLLEKGIDNITVCDKRSKAELQERIKCIGESKVTIKKIENLASYDILFRSPGFPLFNKEILKAREKRVVIYSAIKLFFDLCPCPIIGITGTKGKGTTSSLITEILKKASRDVFLGGNIGRAPFEFIHKLSKKSIVILELSSFQLEDLHRSPHISVITNISEEHLKPADPNNPNYHKSLKGYIKAKANILKFQTNRDYAVLNHHDRELMKIKKLTKGKIYYFDGTSHTHIADKISFIQNDTIVIRNQNKTLSVCDIKNTQLLGEHNLENICAASMATFLIKAPLKSIRQGIQSFKGLEHRLEFIREINGVKYYDESFATTPHSALTAIRALSNPIILILGGVNKGNDFKELAENLVSKNVKTIIIIGKSADMLEKIMHKAARRVSGKMPKLIRGCDTMKKIIDAARKEAMIGDIVLLAPACASFDMFKNYKDRGEQFKREVMAL